MIRRYKKNLFSVPFLTTLIMLLGLVCYAHAQTVDEQKLNLLKQQYQQSGKLPTAEEIEKIKSSPEFKGLTPEELQRIKDDVNKKKAASDKAEQPVEKREATTADIPLKSLFDRTRDRKIYQDISLDLKPFGHDFFREVAAKVTMEKQNIPVPPDYILGPDDEVQVVLWGRISGQYTLKVDRDGKINVPNVGPIFVAGQTFKDASVKIINQVAQITGVNVDIAMGALRTLPLLVLGDVKKPGAYTISALATVTDALLLAGGPSDIGSMRNIQLKRNNKLITTLDLYDLLLKGDRSKDSVLQAGDVVFVPVTGKIAGIAGNVKRPAIYEFKEDATLQNLIDLAGGILPSAYTQQIQIDRIVRNEKRVVLDINDKNLDKSQQIMLDDSDLIKVFSIVEADDNSVYLFGNVKKPGRYEYKTGMRFKDLIHSAKDLLPETDFGYALIKRLKPPALEPELISLNLGKIILDADVGANLELKPRDSVYVFSKWAFKDKPYVTVEGEIRRICRIDDKDETENTAYAKDIDNRNRTEISDKKSNVYYEETKKSERFKKANIELKLIEDELRKVNRSDLADKIRAINENLVERQWVSSKEFAEMQADLKRTDNQNLADRLREIANSCISRCRIEISDNTRIKNVILEAGGLTTNALTDMAELVRVNERREYSTKVFNVEKAMADDPAENIILKDQDKIIIHSIWERSYGDTVIIDGEIAKPGTYQYTQGLTVKGLLFKAGNVLRSAYMGEAEITSFYIDDKKSGRYEHKIIDLGKALADDSIHNVALKPYDRVLVKRITDWQQDYYVNVSGEIKYPGKYSFKKGEKLASIIERAGGYTKDAYLRGADFTRVSVRDAQQKGLDDMIIRLEKELFSGSAAKVSTAVSAEEIKAKEVELGQMKLFVESLKKVRAKGRMTIRLASPRILKGSDYDFEIENGDILNIPSRSSAISVLGSVMSSGSYVYTDKLDYKDYIDMAGGYTTFADEDNVYSLKVDGSAKKLARGMLNWSSKQNRWEMAGFGEPVADLEAGDTIIVPEKVERISWLREIRDIAQIMMNIAVTAAVVIKLF